MRIQESSPTAATLLSKMSIFGASVLDAKGAHVTFNLSGRKPNEATKISARSSVKI